MRLRWAVIAVCGVICLTSSTLASAENAAVSVGVGDTILSVSGKTSPNAFVTISRDGGVIGTTTANAAGEFDQDFPAQDPGLHQISMFASTTGGANTDTVTVTINITEHATTSVDIFLPSTVAIADTSLAYGQQLSLNGEAAPSSTVTVFIDDNDYASTSSNAQGLWSISVGTLALAAGQHTLFVRVTDGFGAQSYPTTERPFSLTARPTAPTPPGQPAPAVPVIDFPTPGLVWTKPSIVVRGTADPGTQIELWDGSDNLGSVWSDDQGGWSIRLDLQSGDYSIKARACLNRICSVFSPTVSFAYRPGGPGSGRPLKITLPQSAFTVYQDQPLNLRAIVEDGRQPYQTVVRWGDGTTTTASYGQDELRSLHRYKQPGKYSAWLDVEDADGRKGRVYFTVEVKPRPAKVWILSLLIVLLLVLVAWLLHRWYRHRRANGRQA